MRRSRCSKRGAPRREPLRSRPPLVPSTSHRPFTPLNAGCTPGSLGNTEQPRRPSDAALGCFDEHGVQPRVGRGAVAMNPALDKWWAGAQRFASSHNGAGRFRAPLFAASRSYAVRGLFFGDFLLAPQKKVTRPPWTEPGLEAVPADCLMPGEGLAACRRQGRTPGNAAGSALQARATPDKNGAAAPSPLKQSPTHHTVIGSLATIALPALHEKACAK
jgi:hypothetical protein